MTRAYTSLPIPSNELTDRDNWPTPRPKPKRQRKAARRPRPRQLEKFRKGVWRLLENQGAVCNSPERMKSGDYNYGCLNFHAWTEYGWLKLHFDHMDDGYCLTVFARFEDHVAASRHITNCSGKWNFHSTANAADALIEFSNQLDCVKFLGAPPAWYRVRRAHDRVMDLVRNATHETYPYPPRVPIYRETRLALARFIKRHRQKGYFWYTPPPLEQPSAAT